MIEDKISCIEDEVTARLIKKFSNAFKNTFEKVKHDLRKSNLKF